MEFVLQNPPKKQQWLDHSVFLCMMMMTFHNDSDYGNALRCNYDHSNTI